MKKWLIMKKKIITGILLTALSSACSEWVNVTPKQEVESNKLFESEIGFNSARIGIYGRMTLTNNYGKTLTYGAIEQLAQRYDNYGTNVPTDASRAEIYDYKNNGTGRSIVNNVWLQSFRTIANINSLLWRLDNGGREVIASEDTWNQMKGEALGLRAFHYLDLLRLYGPVYSENPSLRCLPWRDEVNADSKDLLPADSIAMYIIEDLKSAESLLQKEEKLTVMSSNEWRKHYMNLWAVKALMARTYLWIGDKANAADKAREVIENSGLELATDNREDVSMYNETIFCLGMDNMEEKLKSDWADKTTFSNELYISLDNLQDVFEYRAGPGTTDIRYLNRQGFIHGTNGTLCRKYLGTELRYMEKVPLIRLAEMYYILAESVSLEESVGYINEVRNKRGIGRIYNLVADVSYDEAARTDALNKEYQKEFFAEGQWFYFLKRNNCRTFYRCPVNDMRLYYVLPTPDDEIEYRK